MSDETLDKKVCFERKRRIGIITMNNGEMNVFDAEQVLALRDLIVDLYDNNKIRVVVIQGSGTRAFSAGFDLKNFDIDLFVRDGQDMIYQLYHLPKPTIALVHGYSIGIGFLVALACDFRYASEDAQFSLPEINYEAMFPTHGGCTILPKIVRKISDAKLILYTGDRISAAKAKEMGIVDELFQTKEEMIDAGMAFAKKLASKNPVVMQMIKVALKTTATADLKTGMTIEMETIPIINRPQGMKKEEQLQKIKEYLEKYTIKRPLT
ncbi:MAG: enoyl-CoA hydratase/isomerase family protein [Candidatus Helarchaeota archaeon]